MPTDGRLNWDDEVKKAAKGPKAAEPANQSDDEEKLGLCCWIWSKGCREMDVQRNGKDTHTFNYAHKGMEATFSEDGKHYKLKFYGLSGGVEIVVHGLRLRDAYNRTNDHCMRKIAEAIRDIDPEDGKPLITNIELHPFTLDDNGNEVRRK